MKIQIHATNLNKFISFSNYFLQINLIFPVLSFRKHANYLIIKY
jgi:hypothetical protein